MRRCPDYLRCFETNGEISPRRMKRPDSPSPGNSENQDSCSISTFEDRSCKFIRTAVFSCGKVADVGVLTYCTPFCFDERGEHRDDIPWIGREFCRGTAGDVVVLHPAVRELSPELANSRNQCLEMVPVFDPGNLGDLLKFPHPGDRSGSA